MAMTRNAPADAQTASFEGRRAFRFWLVAVAGLVFLMVLVGGATRLTESGLSITQWKPVTGIVPPLSGADWQAEFDRYKQIPQFAKLNSDMTLDGFKAIFWWEWAPSPASARRGRGFHPARPVLLVDGAAQRRARPTGRRRDRPACARANRRLVDGVVRLERTHGSRTGAIGAASPDCRRDVWRADLRRGRAWRKTARRTTAPRGFAISAWIFAALIFCQLGLGALVAGLRAGLIYNTWPLMGSSLIPGEAFRPSPLEAMFGDAATAQFDHRMIAYAVVVFAIVQAIAALRAAPGSPLVSRAVVLRPSLCSKSRSALRRCLPSSRSSLRCPIRRWRLSSSALLSSTYARPRWSLARLQKPG